MKKQINRGMNKLMGCKRGDLPTWVLCMVVGVALVGGAFTVLQNGLIGTATDKGTAYEMVDQIDTIAGAVDTTP